jgi:hypothetical protein
MIKYPAAFWISGYFIFQRRSGSDRSDVQILSLDDKSRSETFRREGDAEILEIDQPTGKQDC